MLDSAVGGTFPGALLRILVAQRVSAFTNQNQGGCQMALRMLPPAAETVRASNLLLRAGSRPRMARRLLSSLGANRTPPLGVSWRGVVPGDRLADRGCCHRPY